MTFDPFCPKHANPYWAQDACDACTCDPEVGPATTWREVLISVSTLAVLLLFYVVMALRGSL